MLDNKATSDKIRQLETESRLTLPVVKDLRVLCTADDVLHA